jgi:hypothetical protein
MFRSEYLHEIEVLEDQLNTYTTNQHFFAKIVSKQKFQDNHLLVEYQSFITALDLFFPLAEKQDIQRKGRSIPTFDLAKSYRCPEYITKLYLKEFQLLSLNLEDNNYKCKGNFCPYFLRS